MTAPMDPNEHPDEDTEFNWGPGIFPPGIANNEGQRRYQDDFGEEYPDLGLRRDGNTNTDNYARAVADRRTDPTDPESGRDFESLGNPDRYGKNPPLVRSEPVENRRVPDPFEPETGVTREW